LFSSFLSRKRSFLDEDIVQEPLTADRAAFIKNRCQLRSTDEPDFQYLNYGIDERRT
jgi:hypothetical protein